MKSKKFFTVIICLSLLLCNVTNKKIVLAESEWSDWQDIYPENVNNYELETRIVYRYRDRKTTVSLNDSLEGWTLYDSESTWGDWSEWQDSSISSNSKREVNTRTVYQYRDKSTTTSTSSSLSGWTKYDSKTTWGNWSGWSDTKVTGSSTRNVETKQVQVSAEYKQYRYGRWRSDNCSKGVWWHFCNACGQAQYGGTWYIEYTDWLNAPITNFDTGCYCGHGYSYKNEDQNTYCYNGQHWYWQLWQIIPATYKTQYRYQDSTTTYYYYKWGSYSSWSTSKPSEKTDREIKEKTQYSYRDLSTLYYYEKEGEWSNWETTEPYEIQNRNIESKIQYRYRQIGEATGEETTGAIGEETTETTGEATGESKFNEGDVTILPVDTQKQETESSYTETVNTKKQKKGEVHKGDVFETQKSNYKVTNVKKKTVACFGSKKKKEKVVVPKTIKYKNKTYKVTSIAANAFRNNKKLKTVIIGDNVKTVGDNAFRGCTKLQKVSIGKNVTSIGNYAFYSDKNLKTINVYSVNLKKVGKKAFKKIAKKPTAKLPRHKMKKYQRILKGKI